MNLDYEIFFDKRVYSELSLLSKSKRKEAVYLLDRLGSNPFYDVDATFTDEKGRPLHKSLIGNFLVTFSVDHAVKEVKIHEMVLISE